MRVDLRMQEKTYTFSDTSEGEYFLCKGNLYLCCSPYELSKLNPEGCSNLRIINKLSS